jgi:ATP-dependent Zn protease
MRPLRARVLLIALVCLALASPTPAQAAKQVSYPALLAQVKSGPLIRAIINRKRSAIEIKFRDLSEWEAFYPAGAQPQLQRLLHRRHIRVIFASRHRAKAAPRSVHHHLRYVAAGLLGALALIGAVWAIAHRRRRRAAGADAPAGEDAAAPS